MQTRERIATLAKGSKLWVLERVTEDGHQWWHLTDGWRADAPLLVNGAVLLDAPERLPAYVKRWCGVQLRARK